MWYKVDLKWAVKATGLWGHLEWDLDEAIASLSKTTEEE